LTAVSDHSGLSANRAGVLNAQSWRLIIVWFEVRVLPAAPRSPEPVDGWKSAFDECDDIERWITLPSTNLADLLNIVGVSSRR
jgi:hypothetical protein